MTENEVRKYIEELREKARLFGKSGYATAGMEKAFNKSADTIENLLNELESYRAIGTVEEIENSFKKTINAFERANPLIKSALDILQEYQSIGTIEEFKALKEADMKGANRAVDEFANYLHKIAKENNGLRLSSETKSWTHPCIFDYLEEFKNEQTCKEET